MSKRIALMSLMAVVLGLFFSWELKAQRSPEPGEILIGLSERFKQMEDKMDRFGSSLDKSGSREVLMKLDQVLSNQQKILSELEIVKVRASQKR